MRVLFANFNHSATYGGVERWMIDAAAGLTHRGHEALLVGRPRAQAPWLQAAANRGLRIRDDHKGTWAERVLRLLAAMRSERPEVVIAKGKKAARIASWGRSMGTTRRVIFFFGCTHELKPDVWVHRHTWRRVDAGIVVAQGAARWYAEHGFGPLGKLHVLWKGVDLAPFDAAQVTAAGTRVALGLDRDAIAVGMVGRLAWQKGIDHLLAAVRLIRGVRPDLRFFIAGGGSEAAKIASAVARPDVGGAVTLLGPRDDVPALLTAMDIVVLPSRHEVMAQTTLEAMAARRPVVSTRTTGADEAIEDGVSGILVSVGSPDAMARALLELAGDPARRAALGTAARAQVEAHFTMEKMLDRCEGILQAVVAPSVGLGWGARS